MIFNKKYIAFALVALASSVIYSNFSGFDMAAQMGVGYAIVSAIAGFAPRVNLGYGSMLVGADTDPVAEIQRIGNEFKSTVQELREAGNELKAKTANGEAKLDGLKGVVDDLLVKFNITKANLDELEQRAASGNLGLSGTHKVKSVGEQFVESDAFKSFNGDGRTACKATVTTTLAGGDAGNGLMTPAYRDNDLVRIPRRVTVDDLIPTITIDSSAVSYARQLTRNNAAAIVAEGTAKPYSDYSWESVDVTVKTLAHLVKVTRQAWEDAPRLMGEINSEMVYGLDLLREAQILFGTGVGQNMLGIVPQATSYVQPTGVAPSVKTRIDVIRMAMLNLLLRGYYSDGVVLNPADWAAIELQKDAENRYLVSNPHSNAEKRLWGLPVLDTPAMTADNFLVGAFQQGASYYKRAGIEIRLSTENADDFEKNLGTVRAEERGVIGVKRPAAFETGDFTAALA